MDAEMWLTSSECQKTWIINESSLFEAYGLATINSPYIQYFSKNQIIIKFWFAIFIIINVLIEFIFDFNKWVN